MQTKTIKDQWIEWLNEDTKEALNKNLGEGKFPAAQEYIDAGVDPQTYKYWYNLQGWDIDQMLKLGQAIADLDPTGRRLTQEDMDRLKLPYSGYTIAYMFCNGDLSLEQVKELID